MENSSPSPTTKTKKNIKLRTGKIKAKLLSSYYGNPIKDMKLVCITGTTGKSTVAHFVHEILRAGGQHVACLASDQDLKVSTLHKFFSDAWRAGANYVVVTAPAESLEKDVFYGLPIHVAAMTDYVPSTLDAPSALDYQISENTLFDMNPEIVVLNRSDAHYRDFANFAGSTATVTYGSDRYATVQIENSKLYKKGAEAEINIGGTRFTVATFLTGEPVVSYMACATAIASSLHLSPETIADGIEIGRASCRERV